MDEYIEREALMRRIKEIHCAECDSYHGVRCRACWVDDTLDYIDSEPAADVAPVVRCKDCKYSTLPSMQTQIYGKPGTLTCHNRKSPCNRRNVASDDYCSYADRKDDNAT